VDVRFKQISIEESSGRIDGALDEVRVIDMGFTEMHRWMDTLLDLLIQRHHLKVPSDVGHEFHFIDQ
jgi:hypothetical protein